MVLSWVFTLKRAEGRLTLWVRGDLAGSEAEEGTAAKRPSLRRSRAKSARALGDYGLPRREHARVETTGVRTAKAMGLRGLPSKTWQVNCGWVIAANIAADPRRLGPPPRSPRRPGPPGRQPGHAPLPGLAHPREARPARPPADPRHQPRLARERSVPHLVAAAIRPAGTRLTSANHPVNAEGGPPRRSRSRCAPGHPGLRAHRPPRR
jgi:hypothetical protein